MKTTIITYLMTKEHAKLNELLEEFQSENDLKKAKEIFKNFSWNIQKHFFVEEKVVFHIFNKKNMEEIINLLKEHKDMEYLIEKAERLIKSNKKPEISELLGILKSHASLEDEIFYPRLDEELNEEDKALIFERAEEIIGK